MTLKMNAKLLFFQKTFLSLIHINIKKYYKHFGFKKIFITFALDIFPYIIL